MSIERELPFLERLAKGVAALFGTNCEVTVHDLSLEYDSTIVAIENGHVSGRHVGDGASELVLQTLKDSAEGGSDHYNYLARTKDGRIVKSSSIYILDDNGKPVGLFGINFDITDLIMARNTVDVLVSTEEEQEEAEIGTITTNVSDLLDQLIAEADRFVGKPVAMMTKEDKTQAIHFLNSRGAFLIKKAGDKVSRHYDISKYTLYNYMDAES